MNVLIVDDIGTNRRLLRAILEAEGIKTCEASDGLEALNALQYGKIDAIISDILMPRMDGYQLCQKVRRDERFEDLPFIFYTSTYISPADEKLAMNCGADRYIRKPSQVGIIIRAIRELTDPQWRRPKSASMADESLVMREYNEVLVRKLEERNQKLEQAHAEIALANQELERHVKERTADLLVLNQELEAFSHSIAHDLRSPLTAVIGISNFLIEECRGKNSQQVMDDLQFTADDAERMNELTKDLLRLARANRAEMSLKQVDLSALSSAIFDDLRARHPERRVNFRGMPGVAAIGDVGLLRIAFENLLGNAWKYTRKIKVARIEFGVEQRDGVPAFFVGDNGAGFDMASAGKLFSPFCRLHSESEFAGSGIGLSTVQRIIARHGGRIWAKSAIGQGAKFFFTLEPSLK
jgi:two-component system, sensor histidine kinase and response regulator